MIKATIELDRRFKKKVEGMFGKYQFEVGILNDKPHYDPKRGERGKKGQDVLKTYAGGPARQQTRKPGPLTVAGVSEEFRKNLRINYLTEPFRTGRFASRKNRDILNFTNAFFNLVFGRTEKKRAENLLQAVVRNPILRGDYGSNSKLTQRIKGFNRKGIDTAQLFKGIIAVCRVGRK